MERVNLTKEEIKRCQRRLIYEWGMCDIEQGLQIVMEDWDEELTGEC